MRVFITGITGTIGTALMELHTERGDTVFGCARNESKGVEWIGKHGGKATLFIEDAGDIHNVDSNICRLVPAMNRVYHCAAMKHVDLCETDIRTAHKQNIMLTALVAIACQDEGVPLVHVSTDKACLPQSVYGATKLIAERIALNYGAAVVRLGNVIGSSGSVFTRWKEQRDRGESISLTDSEMTRFFITVRKAAEFLADEHVPGDVAVPVMQSVRMGTVAAAYHPNYKVTGMRPGETLHQWSVAPGERGWYNAVKFVIDNTGEESFRCGVSSDKAERWNLGDFLREAGVV